MKKTVVSLLLLLPSLGFAMPSDVTTDTWYSQTVSSFVAAGYLPDNTPFRPQDNATRGEFIKLLVDAMDLRRGEITVEEASFDDVPGWYHDAFEIAAGRGWVNGEDNCLGTHPCNAYPERPINRAEAAALLIRVFGIQGTSDAPSFDDAPQGQWYTESVRNAAGNCVLRGDAGKAAVRPAATLNRAEMVLMVERAMHELTYPNCDIAVSSAKKRNLPAFIKKEHASTPLLKDTAVPLQLPLMQRLEEMKKIETKLYDTALVYKESPVLTSLNILANKYTVLVMEMKKLVDTAKSRTLTKQEGDRANDIKSEADAIVLQFLAAQDAALQTPKTTRSQADIDALRRMIDLSNSGFKQYANAKSVVDSSFVERINDQLKLWDGIITKYEDFLSTALDRALTDVEGKTIEGLQQQELSIINTLNGILEDAKMYRGGSSTYTPSPSGNYGQSHEEYCDELRTSIGISGAWRNSSGQKKLRDAGCE